MAPEVLANFFGRETFYDKRCDVFSYGILLWEVRRLLFFVCWGGGVAGGAGVEGSGRGGYKDFLADCSYEEICIAMLRRQITWKGTQRNFFEPTG
jgi:hypothetical protein